MNEIYIPMPNLDNLNLYLEQEFDGFFIGLENFSSNFNFLVNIEELDKYLEIINKRGLKTFISFNRLYYNNEINNLKKVIKLLNNYDVTGIAFNDVGLLEIVKEVGFNKELLWLSNHLGTNSKTIKFLNKRNVNYFMLSTEITKEEIFNIKNNLNNEKVGIKLFGYLNMATSSRKLLTNYFSYIDEEKKKDKYIIKEKVKNEDYIIVEKENSNFFTNKVLNGIKFYPEFIFNKIDYIFLDDYMLDNDKFSKVINLFSKVRNDDDIKYNIDEIEEKIDELMNNNTFYGFLDKKTVFKVEDYE